MIRRPPRSTLFPYTTLFRSRQPEALDALAHLRDVIGDVPQVAAQLLVDPVLVEAGADAGDDPEQRVDRALELDDLLGELVDAPRSEEHTSELQSRQYLVCRL